MKRVIVLGGLGLFGRTIITELAKLGIASVAASRSSNAPVRCDAEDPAALRATLRSGDLVIDAAGPFHLRTPALIEAAIEIGCDLIDINDNLHYAHQIIALEPQINAANIRVLTSASTVSAIAAAIIRHSGITTPTRISSFLAPATRHTANPGAALSLLRTVGQPILIWREGQLQTALGWTEPRTYELPTPVGSICGRLYESADAIHLPRAWPSLREVTIYVDTRTTGVNYLLRIAALSPVFRRMLGKTANLGTGVARWLGSESGGIGYEIESLDGQVARYALVAGEHSYLTAVAPAILAARAIADGSFIGRGLVPMGGIVEPAKLFAYLAETHINVTSGRD